MFDLEHRAVRLQYVTARRVGWCQVVGCGHEHVACALVIVDEVPELEGLHLREHTHCMRREYEKERA